MHRFALLLSTIAALFSANAGFAADPEVQPNIVVFISDDQGYLDSSLAGAKEFPTPHLRQIARDGLNFTRAFAASPTCAPSRAAFLTGLMPNRNGSIRNHEPPRSDVKKLPAYMQALGYEVVAIGKVAHYKQTKQYGFDHFSHDTFHDDDCIAAAVEFLEQRKGGRPLCLLVGTNWPHVPWPDAPGSSDFRRFRPPPSHVDTPKTRRSRARYAAAIDRADQDLGAIYGAAYKQLGANTLFIFFSDHGGQWPFSKWNLYDAGTRVPFVAVWPNVIAPGTTTDAMISLVDLLPTLIEAGGGTPPEDIDGRSILTVLKGKRDEHRDCVFMAHSGDGNFNKFPIRSVRTPKWRYISNLRPEAIHNTHMNLGKPVDGSGYWQSWVNRAKVDQSAAWVVNRYHHRPAEELYDLEHDPFELHNVAADPRYAQTLHELRDKLADWMRQQNDLGLETEQQRDELPVQTERAIFQ